MGSLKVGPIEARLTPLRVLRRHLEICRFCMVLYGLDSKIGPAANIT